MYVLGINGGLRLGYQDVSAVLMKDGGVVAAIEEERLTRVKHAPGKLSEKSILEVLRIAGISFDKVDVVATHGATWNDGFEEALQGYLKSRFGSVPKIRRHHHHDCHAASAFYASGFESALTITADGSGDGSAMRIYDCEGGKMTLLADFKRPDSLGIFYSIMTQYCGFVRDSDEYKLMGLAPYGNPEKYDLSSILSSNEGKYKLDEAVLAPIKPLAPQPTKQQPGYGEGLTQRLGNLPPRNRESAMSQEYKDLAAATQAQLENTMLSLVRYWMEKTGHRNLCLAGGVALNCAMNKRLSDELDIEDMYVQPASSDAGISLGAAYLSCVENGIVTAPMPRVDLGTEFSNEEIENTLRLFGLKHERVEPAKTAARLIAEGKVIGWFQGRSEFGPRALGHRSILASAAGKDMKATINEKIKFRESFRPFCPSVLEEDMDLYFQTKRKTLPFMTINVSVKNPSLLPAITHVDGTARVQSVSAAINPMYHQLLSELKKITGHGVCVNTSFNRSVEPMVNNPREAVSVFFGSGLDALVIGDFLIEKPADRDLTAAHT